MAEPLMKTTDEPPPGAGAFQRHYDSIQVACDPDPPLWPSMETPEAAEAREEQGLPPPKPFKHVKYDHSRLEAARAKPRPSHEGETAKREAEASKAGAPRR